MGRGAQQLVRVSEEKEEGSRRSQRQCADLVRELNGLQYELQCMEEHLRRSQQSWLDKLNRQVLLLELSQKATSTVPSFWFGIDRLLSCRRTQVFWGILAMANGLFLFL